MLTFDANTHTYRVGEIVPPSVTEVLKATGVADDFSGVDPYYAERGHRMHDIAAAELMGFKSNGVDPDLVPFVQSFHEFIFRFDPEPLHVEHRMHTLKPPCAGTADFIGSIYNIFDIDGPPRLWLLDWKAGQYRPYYDTQVTAYTWLARRNGIEVERAGVVSLKENPPRIRECDLEVQTVVWERALELFHERS